MREPRSLELTDKELDALEIVIGLALSDQHHYLQSGDPEVDYGEEWPEDAAAKAETWTHMKAICRALGLMGFASSAEILAQDFNEAAHDGCGLCVTCGTQCVPGGDLSVICPKCSAVEDGAPV